MVGQGHTTIACDEVLGSRWWGAWCRQEAGAGVGGTPAEGLEAARLDQAKDRGLLAKAHLALGRMDVDVDGLHRQAQGQRADREQSRCHQPAIGLLDRESETPARYRAPVNREVQVLATAPQASGLADPARDRPLAAAAPDLQTR